jgi:hypothetical protein
MKTKQTTGILLFLCLCGFLVSCGPRKEQELSNGNWIISKTSDGEKRFGIESSNGNILVEPTYESIVPIEDEPSILECANSSIFGSCELITQDGRRLFEELGKYTYKYSKKRGIFILRTDNREYCIARQSGKILYRDRDALINDILFANGINNAYIKVSQREARTYEIINEEGAPYINSIYDYVGVYAIDRHKKRAIDLLTGNSYKVIRPIDKDYIELENGIISGISHKILVSYGKPDASDTTTVWLDKKYITPDENGIPPYSCTKIIGDIVYFSPNISEGTFDILYKANNKGTLLFSPYNFTNIRHVLEYIEETEMSLNTYSSTDPERLIVDYNYNSNWGGRFSIGNRTEFLKQCKINPNGQWAVFNADSRYRFYFNTETLVDVRFIKYHDPLGSSAYYTEEARINPSDHRVLIKNKEYRPWLNTSWSDGVYTIRFDMNNVYVVKNGRYLGYTPYTYDRQNKNITFNLYDPEEIHDYPNASFVSLIIIDGNLLYEGGDGEGFTAVI